MAFAIWVQDYATQKLDMNLEEFFEGVYYPRDKRERMTTDTFRQIRRFKFTETGQEGRRLNFHDICAIARRLRKKPSWVVREVELFLDSPAFLEASAKYKKE